MNNSHPIKVSCRPAIIRIQEKTYAVGGLWLEIPKDTRMDQLDSYMVYQPTNVITVTKKFLVKSEKKNSTSEYIVEVFNNKEIVCNCMGFKFKKKCKHTLKVKEGL